MNIVKGKHLKKKRNPFGRALRNALFRKRIVKPKTVYDRKRDKHLTRKEIKDVI